MADLPSKQERFTDRPVETLADGSLRLSGKECTFLFRRLSPGVLLTVISGRDTGEWGALPLELVEAESARFRMPLTWFIDASRAPNAVNQVFRLWTDWLQERKQLLQRMHVLTSSRPLHLTVSIARHLSQTEHLMVLHAEPADFTAALAEALPGQPLPAVDPGWVEEPAANISVERNVGTVTISTEGCSFQFQRLAPDTMLVKASGRDTGSLSAMVLDEMQAILDQADSPLHWFLDARDIQFVAGPVAGVWGQWLQAHEESFVRVHILATAGAVPMIVTLARFRLRNESLMQVHRDEASFTDLLQKHLSTRR